MPLFQLFLLAAAPPEERLTHDVGEIVVETAHYQGHGTLF